MPNVKPERLELYYENARDALFRPGLELSFSQNYRAYAMALTQLAAIGEFDGDPLLEAKRLAGDDWRARIDKVIGP